MTRFKMIIYYHFIHVFLNLLVNIALLKADLVRTGLQVNLQREWSRSLKGSPTYRDLI